MPLFPGTAVARHWMKAFSIFLQETMAPCATDRATARLPAAAPVGVTDAVGRLAMSLA